MSYQKTWKQVPLPDRMKDLPKDRRGYPIPANIYRDDQGNYHFIINDQAKRSQQLHDKVCAICDQDLGSDTWIVGGPLSAFHPRGAYSDTPMHEDCMKYALRVCPYLAVRPYTRPDPDKVTERVKSDSARIYVDYTQIPDQPQVFIAVKIRSWVVNENDYVIVDKNYLAVEVWCEGEQIKIDQEQFDYVS